MTLSMEQLQVLSELAITNNRLRAVLGQRDRAEEKAWLAGIGDRQVAAVGRCTARQVEYRRTKRHTTAVHGFIEAASDRDPVSGRELADVM